MHLHNLLDKGQEKRTSPLLDSSTGNEEVYAAYKLFWRSMLDFLLDTSILTKEICT